MGPSDRKAVGPDSGSKSKRTLLLRTGGSTINATQKGRADHQHFFSRRAAGVAGFYALLLLQGRAHHADPVSGQGTGTGYPYQQHCSGHGIVSWRKEKPADEKRNSVHA